MKPHLYIEYNPYTLETMIEVNGEKPKATSFFNIKDGIRIQEWIENLPEKAFKELNENELNIKFKGINMDFEDLKFVCNNFKEAKFKLEHVPGKEIEEKEKLVRKIFNKMANGLVEDLKGGRIEKLFDSVLNNMLEVNVLATMSSGKSTVINAILDKEILPSENKACTAIIFKIIDNDNEKFKVIIKDNNGNEIRTYTETEKSKPVLDVLKELNNTEYIKENDIGIVELYGDIPFVKSEEEQLVLVDTPGPNNANNEDHGMVTQKMIESSNKDLILYIMDGTTLTSDDSNDFLDLISKSMKEGGLQARDRFIFVLNKMDNLKENESLEEIIEEARKLLKRHRIENPKIFPISGLAALKLRNYLKTSQEKNLQTIDYMVGKRSFEELSLITNFNGRIHLEEYGNLTGESSEKIKKELEEAKSQGNIVDQAIIHTGIRSLEEAISVYLNKYFKTAKIKNTSEAIIGTMKSIEIENKIKTQIMDTEESRDLAKKNIDIVKKELETGKKAEKLYKEIDKINLKSSFRNLAKEVLENFDQWMVKYIMENKDKKIERDRFYKEIDKMQKNINMTTRTYLIKMEKQIENILIKESKEIINEYKNYLSEISKKLSFEDVNFNMGGVLASNIKIAEQTAINKIIDKNTYVEEVIVGTETRRDNYKKWYRPSTWRDPRYYTVDIKEDKDFVEMEKVLKEIFKDVDENFTENIQNGEKEGLSKQSVLKAK